MRGWPVVDSVQFARQHGNVHRPVAIAELERLASMVSAPEVDFDVQLDGFEDSERRPCLRLQVSGRLPLVCQRCLEPLMLEIAANRCFVLAQREQDLPDLSEEGDDIESLLADGNLNVLALVEDEILLQIPMAPMHTEGTCVPPELAIDGRENGSAFGVLGTLMNTED